ncbi:unnamed protein product [Caenorhabditis sp. 36 PRJEB53466]|nr:unnamed protein product [Caenorhabditis sp. 36 PRJEB53466]
MLTTSSKLLLLQTNPDARLFWIGVIYSLLGVSIIPIYAIVIYTLHIRNELRENVSYKLINLLNYCDVFQSICHVFTGSFVIFPVLAARIDVFVRIVGCTANTLWLATFVVLAVLATARIRIAFFNLKATKWGGWMKSALSVGAIYILFVWIAGCVTQNFQLTAASWSYDMTVPFADVFAQLELVLCYPVLLLSFCSYALISLSIYRKRRSSQSHLSRRVELGILIQATILTVYMAGLIALWHNAEDWFDMNNITLAALNSVWILFSYLNIFLLLAVNSAVRRQFLMIVSRKESLKSRFSSKITVSVAAVG